MALKVLSDAPSADSFTPLSEHQSQTPGTFFGGRPVLHFHSPAAKLRTSRTEYEQFTALRNLGDLSSEQLETNGETSSEDVNINDVDIWIASKDVILFSPSKGKGIAISYPAIALHALGTHNSHPAVYLQLNLHDAELTNSEDEMETLDLHIIPATPPAPESPSNPAKYLYDAMSACADLHPDPATPDEDGEDTQPGTGGWITSENMRDFMDEEGNFVGPGVAGNLGAGAGTVRGREEEEEEEEEEEVEGGVNGDGGVGETKWQRTG